MDKRSARTIIDSLKAIIARGDVVSKAVWLDAAFMLSLFREDEAAKFNQFNLDLAKEKKRIYEGQDKKNVSAADIEIQAMEKYRDLKNQEAMIYTIEELIRIAKKNSEQAY